MLTKLSGMTEHQRAVWTMSSPVSSAYDDGMQEFCRTVHTSEQHKEASASRTDRDKMDLAKIATKLEQHSPFSDEVTLCSIITGINADEDANTQDLFIVGRNTVNKMEGQSVFSYSHK